MAEEVHVWVKTEAINPGNSHHSRALPGSFSDNDDRYVDWGWTYAVVVDRSETTLEISILDEDNPNHGKNYHLSPDAFEKGAIVAANKHCGDTGFDNDGEVDIKYYPDDLITLTHLHEPAVVHCLQQRYAFDKIYTATGSILLALNPFKQCKQLYNQSVMETYWKRGEAKMGIAAALDDDEKHRLPPHVYSIADDCFRVMIKRLNGDDLLTSTSTHKGPAIRARPGGPAAKATTCDQTILVSGESGSGKTVTTKFIMQYLAALSQRVQKANKTAARNGIKSKSASADNGGTSPEEGHKNVEQQVLESNPILESFGNARTIRNDNSSRFGKFIEIKFSKTGTLIGASIETYLLEKVRLLSQAEGERNYHIFYELFCMSDEELEALELHEYTLEDFNMINKSGTFDRRDGVEDSETYAELRHAMGTMGFQEDEQQDALSIAAACLHGANLTFVDKNADESALDYENQHLEPFTKLLGLTPEALDKALCYLKIKAGKEYHTRTLPKAKAEKGLEALIKATYGALFTQLVRRINESITVKDSSAGKGRRPLTPTTGQATIGVLDIFGFESFKVNSFEQLCINYCNEALQHQFNMFVLEKEQEEYEREGIEWSFISFPGNQDVLDLIDKTGSGILRILDDQCRAPGTTDKTFCGDLYKKCTGHPRFEANHRQVGALKFAVRHYAGLVEYDTDGFVEKNRDELPREAADLLLSSTRPAIQNLAIILSDSAVSLGGPATTTGGPGRQQSRSVSPKRPSGGGGTRVTVGGQFAQQLQELRNKIDLTAPHYVRCLKPNDILVPDHFDPLIISDQLRYAGVIEAVRVSRAGFPQRYSHAAFVSRYRVLGFAELKKAARSTRKTKPVEVLAQAVAFSVLEVEERKGGDGIDGDPAKNEATKNSNDAAGALRAAGIQVGKTKVFLRRNAFDTLELLRTGKMAESAVQIQAIARRYIVRRDYRSIQASAVTIQSLFRMVRDTRRVDVARKNYRATLIQKSWRRSVLMRRFRCIVNVSRWCQKIQRGRKGRRRFEALNRERKATLIQKYWRRFPIARQYRTMKKSAVTAQCAFRCWVARKQRHELRLQARDLGAAVKERDELKLLVKELEDQLAKQKRSVADVAKNSDQTQALASLQSKLDNVSTENGHLHADVKQLQEKFKAQEEQAQEARKQVDELRVVVETQRKENEALAKSLADRDKELLESRAAAEEALAIKSSVDALTLNNQQLTLEMQSIQSKWEQESAAAAEAKELAKSLQLALDARVKENESLTKRLDDTEQELREARDNQVPAMKDSSDNGMSTLSLDKTNDWSLAEENDQLRQEIFDLKEGAKSRELVLSDKLKAAQKTIEELKSAPSQPHDGVNEVSTSQVEELKRELSSAKRKYQTELKEARDQIKHLERRLSEAEEDTSFTVDRPSFTIIPSEASTQEILTLQDEVAQLNKELAAAKTLIESRSGQFDANSPEALALRFSELRRLSEACLEKDQEINRLKSQLDSCGSDDVSHMSFSVQSGGSPEGVDLLRQDIRELKAQLTSRSIPEEGPESDDRSVALERKNKELRSEVESSKKKISQLEISLKEERERSMEDLKAFSRTLLEVDELRSSAQTMSRQLALAKVEAKRKKQQPIVPGRRARNGGFHRHRALVDIPPLWGSKAEKKSTMVEQDADEEEDDDDDLDDDDFEDGAKSVVTSRSGGRPGGKQKRRGSGSSMFSAFF